MRLDDQIENTRKELNELVSEYGVSNEKTISKSEELDRLINKSMTIDIAMKEQMSFAAISKIEW